MSRKEEFDHGASKYDFKPGASEPYYKDSDFSSCPDCGALGTHGVSATEKNAEGKWGKEVFFHRVNKGNGMFGFETGHKE
jgi:hypothetical protein